MSVEIYETDFHWTDSEGYPKDYHCNVAVEHFEKDGVPKMELAVMRTLSQMANEGVIVPEYQMTIQVWAAGVSGRWYVEATCSMVWLASAPVPALEINK